MDRDQHFLRLTGLLAKYEPGDLLLLSDIMDGISELGVFYAGSPVCMAFIGRLLGWIKEYFCGKDCPDFADQLGQSLALLERWKPGTSDVAITRIETQMAQFQPDIQPVDPVAVIPEPPVPSGTAHVADTTSAANAGPAGSNSVFMSKETFAVFIADARERLSQAQELLLVLEAHPDDPASLTALFRVFHTIKGESGFLHLVHLGDLTHRLENILDLLRDGRIELTGALTDLLLSGVDRCLAMVNGLPESDPEYVVDPGLASYLEGLDAVVASVQPPLGRVLVADGKLREKDVAAILEEQRLSVFKRKFGEIAVKDNLISREDLAEALGNQTLGATGDRDGLDPQKHAAKAQDDEFIKVRLGKVNFLVDMIGELTIALGQVNEESLAVSQVKKITRSLQFGAMELRTDTMQGLFNTAHRIIRDLSRNLGKQVSIKTEGSNLEIDRNLIKNLEEPLMHLVRNALDHGLETSEERIAAGKPDNGSVSISAVRHGSVIAITVADDGRGLDRERILAKAVEKGLIRPDQSGDLSDAQIFDFICQPGFSTSSVVSQISGRGVGMDIVRSMVSASRGSLNISTKPGQGTAFVMTFPISTAIIDGLLVRVGASTLIVPVSSVVESLKIGTTALTMVGGQAELITIRDTVMPVIRLEKVLGMELKMRMDQELGIEPSGLDDSGRDSRAQVQAKHLIGLIVENSDHKPHFLVIDEVLAKKEVVVKPLGPRFRTMQGITAGTVLAGGSIGLVLDVDQVINLDK